ncbi:MAG: c-type cytochrome [Deltaproteobacteria bacterium]|nr:c-type cytochrome [Deltaproteobacteria bacterium]
MNRTHLLLSLTVLAAAALSPAAWAEEDLSALPSEQLFSILRGGHLYDHWGKTTHQTLSHFTYPEYTRTQGEQQGPITWLCHECHGWDYLGDRGVYQSGPHFTNVHGIYPARNYEPELLVAGLKEGHHKFGAFLKEADLKNLAEFIIHGQIYMNSHIDTSTRKAKGDITKGKRLYQVICAECHGEEGKKSPSAETSSPPVLGAVAKENPWMTFHRIRVGVVVTFDRAHPVLLTRPVQAQVDVLAYLQTLPAK